MKKLICGILMLGTIAGVYGQKVMSLEECRLLALENNKKLKMADEQINAAKAKICLSVRSDKTVNGRSVKIRL